MRFLHNDLYEINLKRIIYNFFEEKDNYTINEFISKSLEKNFDIIEIFNTFFNKFKFFNNEQIKLYEYTYLNHLKLWKKTKNYSLNLFEQSMNVNTSVSTNAFVSSPKSESSQSKLYKINISKEAEEYINLINKSFIEYEPFEAEDNEMRRDMEEFDRDLYTTMTSLQRNLIKVDVKDLNENNYQLSNRSNRSLSPYQKYSRKMNKNNLQFAKVCKSFFNQNTFDSIEKSELIDSKNIILIKSPNVKRNFIRSSFLDLINMLPA
jgi:HD-GYP domain-containing protein (c-di-GMP phosphodiesterase class II)